MVRCGSYTTPFQVRQGRRRAALLGTAECTDGDTLSEAAADVPWAHGTCRYVFVWIVCSRGCLSQSRVFEKDRTQHSSLHLLLEQIVIFCNPTVKYTHSRNSVEWLGACRSYTACFSFFFCCVRLARFVEAFPLLHYNESERTFRQSRCFGYETPCCGSLLLPLFGKTFPRCFF